MLLPEEEKRVREEYRALVELLIEKIVADHRKAFRVRAEARAKDFLSQLKREFEAGIAAINRSIGDKQPIEVWGVDLADMSEIEAAGGFASFFS